MTHARPPRKPPRPLDRARLQELAIHYVGRFATTRSRLASYLQRKLRERGWDGEHPPDLSTLVERLAELGYIDDAAFALGKARSLGQRGYGERRVDQALRQAGIEDDDGVAARSLASEGAVMAAVRFARRRRIGPFAVGVSDPKVRDRALSAMLRAGHSFDLSRRIVNLSPDADVDIDRLAQALGS